MITISIIWINVVISRFILVSDFKPRRWSCFLSLLLSHSEKIGVWMCIIVFLCALLSSSHFSHHDLHKMALAPSPLLGAGADRLLPHWQGLFGGTPSASSVSFLMLQSKYYRNLLILELQVKKLPLVLHVVNNSTSHFSFQSAQRIETGYGNWGKTDSALLFYDIGC